MNNFRGHFVAVLSVLFLSTQAQAQTVDECRAEITKVQNFMEDQPDSMQHPADIASDHLEMAENEADQGNGKKCMEYVEQAKGAVGYYSE